MEYQKEWNMRIKMKKRLTETVYTDDTYGNRACLWSVSRSVFEVPQKVSKVPTGYVLFKTVMGKKDDSLNGSDLARKWNRLAKEKKEIWKKKAKKLKEEQQRQIRWGAVRVRTADDSDDGEDEGQ